MDVQESSSSSIPLTSLLCASNVFTYNTTFPLTSMLKSQRNTEKNLGFEIIACDTMRCHPRKPGFLTPSYTFSKTVYAEADDSQEGVVGAYLYCCNTVLLFLCVPSFVVTYVQLDFMLFYYVTVNV